VFADRYSPSLRYSQGAIDADDNLLSLRADIHKVFDEKLFAIVPKCDPSTAAGHSSLEEGRHPQPGSTCSDPKLVLHIFKPLPDLHFNQVYHNRSLLPFRCSKEYLFALLAWTILSPNVMGLFFSANV